MIAGLAVIGLWLAVMMIWPCRFGMHKWDQPGGQCMDCSKKDDFWEPKP